MVVVALFITETRYLSQTIEILLSSSLRIKHLVNQTQSTLIQSTLVCGLQQRIHSVGMDGSLRVMESVLTTVTLSQVLHTLLINFYSLYSGNCINLHDFIVHDDWGRTIETSLQVHILDGNVSLQYKGAMVIVFAFPLTWITTAAILLNVVIGMFLYYHYMILL